MIFYGKLETLTLKTQEHKLDITLLNYIIIFKNNKPSDPMLGDDCVPNRDG